CRSSASVSPGSAPSWANIPYGSSSRLRTSPTSRVGRHLRTTHHRGPRLRLTELIHEHQDAEAQRLQLTTSMTGTETKWPRQRAPDRSAASTSTSRPCARRCHGVSEAPSILTFSRLERSLFSTVRSSPWPLPLLPGHAADHGDP